ncbi:MAG: hypothetical protein ACKV2U_21305 [Bryobacteraceae bacterium]
MNTNGDIIMTDATKIVRINYNPTTQTYPSAGGYSICMKTTTTTPVACTSSGTALDPLPGYPVSPILLNNGTMVVLATRAPGYVFAFWADDLTYIHRTPVTGLCTGGATCPYEARNTPAASYTAENRFYVSMNAYEASTLEEHSGYGQMIAFEANSITGTIDTKWSYSFAGPSGASPVVLPVAGGSKSDIYFDGFGNMDPRLIKVADDGGSSYTFRWQSTSGDFPNRIPASVTVDTGKGRSCVWAYSIARQLLKCVNLGNTYNVDNTIDVGSLVPASFPASVLTMTHPSTGGAVILLCVNFVGTNPGRILAIQVTGDYTTSNFSAAKYWDFALPQNGEYAPTQFPIVTDTTGPYSTLAFPTSQNRLYLYSNKP